MINPLDSTTNDGTKVGMHDKQQEQCGHVLSKRLSCLHPGSYLLGSNAEQHDQGYDCLFLDDDKVSVLLV